MDDLNPIWIILPLFPVVFVGFWMFVCLILSVVSGWRSLAEAYPAVGPADGEPLSLRSARIGLANYNHCLTLTAGPSHLHVAVLVFFRFGHVPFSVPWTEIAVSPSSGFLFRGFELRFQRVPRVRVLMNRKTVAALATASRGQLVVDESA